MSVFFVCTMKDNGDQNQLCYQQASKYICLCSTKERFETWEWVNYDRMYFFWVNYPFNVFIIIIYLFVYFYEIIH